MVDVGVILSSIFRDSTGYIDRWVEQVAALHEHRPLSVVVAEGDSTDDTRVALVQAIVAAPFDGVVLHVDHGGPKYGSYDIPDRWARIALVCNAVAARVAETIGDDDAWLYVESDLVWSYDTPLALIDGLRTYPATTAMSMYGPDGLFYDRYGHVGLDGRQFSRRPPYHPSLDGSRWVELASAGSIFAMRGPLARVCRFSEADCIRGIGRSLRTHGGSLWLDTRSEVIHPPHTAETVTA